VKLLEGRVSDPTPSEKETFTAEQLKRMEIGLPDLSRGRLQGACSGRIHDPRAETQVEGLEITVPLNPLLGLPSQAAGIHPV